MPLTVQGAWQISRLLHYERILVEIVVFERGWVTMRTHFRGNGALPINDSFVHSLLPAEVQPTVDLSAETI